jgi:hypothetical protein
VTAHTAAEYCSLSPASYHVCRSPGVLMCPPASGQTRGIASTSSSTPRSTRFRSAASSALHWPTGEACRAPVLTTMETSFIMPTDETSSGAAAAKGLIWSRQSKQSCQYASCCSEAYCRSHSPCLLEQSVCGRGMGILSATPPLVPRLISTALADWCSQQCVPSDHWLSVLHWWNW